MHASAAAGDRPAMLNKVFTESVTKVWPAAPHRVGGNEKMRAAIRNLSVMRAVASSYPRRRNAR
jgi:hypothetical protein